MVRKPKHRLRENIAKRICTLRKSANLSQKGLSAKIGMSDTMIGQVERGAISPSLKTIKKLAEFFNVHPSYFFADSDDLEQMELEEEFLYQGIPSSIVTALRLYSKDLTPEAHAEVLMFIKLVAEREKARKNRDT